MKVFSELHDCEQSGDLKLLLNPAFKVLQDAALDCVLIGCAELG